MPCRFAKRGAPALLALAVICWSAPAHAVSTLNGVEPGVSTRAEAEKVFGAPTAQVSSVRYAYAPSGGTSGIEIEYTAAQIVVRIDLSFAPPLARDAVVRGLNLPTDADARDERRPADGVLRRHAHPRGRA